MIKGIDKIANKEKIAIVAVGYNRLKAISRLLDSLNNAYYDINDVPLVLSIDASGNQALYKYVKEFEWAYGPKYVNIQEKRLGLKNHIFQCMSLSQYFKGVIILEDDIFVSPYFYNYACQTMDKYGDDEHVAGIAFYRNEYDGYSNIPIVPYFNGQDVMAWKSICTWGEMLNERMWNQFSEWLSIWDEDFSKIDMNETIKGWSRAWSKYFYAYIVSANKYFIFPYESLTTNFNDAGGEHGGGEAIVQVSLMQGKRNYQLGGFGQLVKYDAYGNNESIASWLNIDIKDLAVHFNQCSRTIRTRFILTHLNLPYKIINSYALSMRPWELNVKYGIIGDDVYLYDRETCDPLQIAQCKYPFSVLMYFFGRYKKQFSPLFAIKNYYKILKKKLKK